jgi:hypothetical protein
MIKQMQSLTDLTRNQLQLDFVVVGSMGKKKGCNCTNNIVCGVLALSM